MILAIVGALIGSQLGRRVGEQLGVAVEQEIARQVAQEQRLANERSRTGTPKMPGQAPSCPGFVTRNEPTMAAAEYYADNDTPADWGFVRSMDEQRQGR